MINKSYAIFGLGRYGYAVARELVSCGADVLAVDKNEALVNSAIADIPYCKCADVTDADTVKQLGIANVDVVVIAMASNVEANVMAIMLCKEIGVETVIVKCSDEMQARIYSKVGADRVVLPEKESGTRLAKNLLSSGFVDAIELSEDVSIVELDTKDEWVGKSLLELNFRKKYSFNVIAIKDGEKVHVDLDPSAPLTKNMKLVVIAHTSKLAKLK